jgi:cardiolipin synthase
MIWVVIILILFILQLAMVLIAEFRHPNKTIAWLMILFILPMIGFVMYYFLAKEYSHKKMVKRKGEQILDEFHRDLINHTHKNSDEADTHLYEIRQVPRLYGLLTHIPSAPITKYNKVKVLTNAYVAYEEMLTAIEQAKKYVHFQFYTIRSDQIGSQFMEALVRKVKEGVKVRVIYDGVGSYHLAKAYISKLRQQGIEIFPFLPPWIAFFDKRMNYRNHRKIIVIDGITGFTGGMNIGDEYLGANPRLGFWRDTHLKLEGDSVYYLHQAFVHDWYFVSREKLIEPEFFPEHKHREERPVQIIASGPDGHWDSILEMFFGGMAAADQRIYITTPYFIPDASITMALKTAAFSGVDVRIIMPYVGDSRLVQYASRSYFIELMQAGVRFYLYRKGFIHAKVVIIDQLMATVGSANMDMRSFFSNFEMNAVFFDKETMERLEDDFRMDLQECSEIKLEEFEQRSRMERIKEVAARLLSPLF